MWTAPKSSPALGLLLSVILLVGCGDSDSVGALGPGAGTAGAGAATSTSELCEGLVGGEAILWDLYNGVIRTDPGLPPPIPQPSQLFAHPSQPLLGFFHPTGWVSEVIDGGLHDFGVNLLRADARAIWRQHTTTVDGVPNVREVRDAEITALRAFFGIDAAQVTTVCLNEGTFDAGGGIPIHASNILLRGGDWTIVVLGSVTPFPGLPTSSIRRQVVAAPTAEFSARAMDTFLAIDFQMLVGENSNLFDSDGDGWRDGVDEFPQDPTRH